MNGLGPILCAPLVRRVDDQLLILLSSLSREEWDLPTIVPRWRVRDIAAHLLDTSLRKLSRTRDGYKPEVAANEDLVTMINRLNQEGVTVYGRLSPPVLIDLLRTACAQSADLHESLDPYAPATGVSWAGEQQSATWFDTARELTERWHHQQQIRLATNRTGIMTRELYYPVLDCFLRGLPYHYRDVKAEDGALLIVDIAGESGGQWFLLRRFEGWKLADPSTRKFTSRVTIPQELAWRLFTKGLDPAHAEISIDGDRDLGERVLSFTAIVG